MSRVGLVLETADKEAKLLTSRRGICDGCSEQASCSFDKFAGEGKSEVVAAVNPIQAKPGDYVEFDLAGRAELKISLMVWVAPLVGLLAGAFAGAGLRESFSVSQDIGVLLGSILGFLAAFLPVIIFDRRSAGKKEFIPLIMKKLERTEKFHKTSAVETAPTCPD